MTTPKKTWSKARKRFYDQRRVWRIFSHYDDAGFPSYLTKGYFQRFTIPHRSPLRRLDSTITTSWPNRIRTSDPVARGPGIRAWLRAGYIYY